jgi:hypothetical protein
MSTSQDRAPLHAGSTSNGPARSGAGEPNQISGDLVYQYILGAVFVILMLVAVLTFANPEAMYHYLAVAGQSLHDSHSPGLKTLRVGIEVQTILMLAGLVIAAIFCGTQLGAKSSSRGLGYGVFAAVVVLTFGLLVFRSLSATHLDVFFWLLAILYAGIAAISAYAAYHFFTRRSDKVSAGLLMILAILFATASAGAISVGAVAITGEAAQDIIDEMQSLVQE